MLRLRQVLKQHSKKGLAKSNQGYITSSSRSFAIFGKSANEGEVEFSQQRSQEDIARNIEIYKANIRQKSEQGSSLARSIASSVEKDKHLKLQRYEIFIDKMQKLYKSEVRFSHKQAKKLQLQKNAILFSQTPLKDILKYYNDLAHRGFNSETAAKTLSHLEKALRARGFKGRVQTDYSASELDQSWRMQKLVDDIKFGLRADQFFAPQHLAQVAQGLADIGYKNTELLPLFFEKLEHQLNERQLGVDNESKELAFGDAVFGGAKGLVSRHYVFKGFQSNEEFGEYLEILMDWEREASTKPAQNENAAEVQKAMQDIINAAVQVKELQKDYQASIDNVRQQYFIMQQAADKHQFLQENNYIKYDLLELQELLVKGGYLDPQEAADSSLANEPFDQRMQRASDVFYDYVINYAPELLSPQHSKFYEAAAKQPRASKNYLEEQQNEITLKTFSQTLVGLAEQALSFRRDVVDRDYLNKFYEDYLMPQENKKYLSAQNKDLAHKLKAETVLMERSYLRGWQQLKHHGQILVPRMRTLVAEDKDSLDGQLNALNALSTIRLEEAELRKQIVDNCLRLTEKNKQFTFNNSALVSGLRGLALSPSFNDKERQLSSHLSARLDIAGLSFSQMIDAAWSLCALELYQSRALAKTVEQLNRMNFERVDSDVKYEEYLKLLDIYNALRIEGGALQLTQLGLVSALKAQDMYLNLRFAEAQTNYDPFKQRVVQALAKGLTNASIEHQVISESEIFQAQKLDEDVLNKSKYPYKPDLLMGYKGHKVGVFVLSDINSTSDTHKPDGASRFRMRLIEKAHLSSGGAAPIKTAGLAVSSIVDIDIEKFKLNLNENFNLISFLDQQVPHGKTLDFGKFSAFGSRLIPQAAEYIEKLPDTSKDVNKLDTLINKMYQVLYTKQQNELRFEKAQKEAGYDELRFQLMKLALIYDTLSKESQAFVNGFVQDSDFKGILHSTLESLPKSTNSSASSVAGFDDSWLGTRLEVELPVNRDSSKSAIKKSIVPELINQRFMWVDDYFHYADWKQQQQKVYDNFNLLAVPSSPQQDKFFFDKDQHGRRIPQGVFPYPNHKRQLMLPAANHTLNDILRPGSENHDELIQFEKEPYKMMVLAELKKAESLLPIDDDTSMITNLQNIKQGLKSDYSDKEILNTILLNLNFTDGIIEEHLNLASRKNKPLLVPRDAKTFREFVESTYSSKDREDPFSHFYLKEAKNREEARRLLDEERHIIETVEEGSNDVSVLEKGKKRREALQEKIENMLMLEENKNEDLNDLSSSLKTHANINYDMKTLMRSENIYDIEPELIDKTISDEDYLSSFRRRAEAKLIKSKIIYKLQNSAQDKAELTGMERQYLKKWIADLKQGKDRNLLNLRDSMVPQDHTKLTIGDVEAKSLYALNSISRVSLERDRHGQFCLSDLIVELSHFLDEDVVNKVETEIFSDRLRTEWGLSPDFKVIETRNKEIGLVLNELEEVAWRSAGQLTEFDFENIKKMVSVKRNTDYFDKQFYENDMASMRHFFEAANAYDNRLALIERWIIRKEDEFNSRVILPNAAIKKPDHILHEEIDAPLKAAREKLAAKLLTADEHGNTIENKEYAHLTSKELHSLTENLCLRLYLFNYKYPAFVPQVIRAVREHPNLLKSDADQMDLYCRMFELDWRGDSSYQNKQEFMSSHPIYLQGTNLKSFGPVTEEVIKEKLQKACAPYVEDVAKRIMSSL